MASAKKICTVGRRFLKGPQLSSWVGMAACDLIQRYVDGESWDDPEWKNLLKSTLRNAQAEAARRDGAPGPRDAELFYLRAAELLQDVLAEVSTKRN